MITKPLCGGRFGAVVARRAPLLAGRCYSQSASVGTKVFSTQEVEQTEEQIANRVTETVDCFDGCQGAAYVAYAMSEVSFIYPISPATSMGEHMDAFASKGIKNAVTNQIVDVEVMQSEAGAAGAVHGALTAGSLASTFTASQGLLLMIPNLYLIAGELTPTVFHIAARTVARHALSIYNDHSDVMACRQTGWAQLCSNNVQEVLDLALISHIATLKAQIPFMHFFDGNRTSSEIEKITKVGYDDMAKWVPRTQLRKALQDRALNSQFPVTRGSGQRPDVFFQASVAAQPYFDACPGHTQKTMDEFFEMTGRRYNLFDYVGHPEAEKVVIMMGSGADTAEQYIRAQVENKGEKIGLIKVRLFRPWSEEHFMNTIPKSVKGVVVLDKCREETASKEPLYLDVAVTLSEANMRTKIIGGSYGISQKEFTPTMVGSVLAELDKEKPKKRFVIGINDDVSHTSIDYAPEDDATMPPGTRQCMFWGLGSDGTVGANKEAIKMIGDTSDLYTQGYFAYDSKKSGGVTMSHLRFGPKPIQAKYEIKNADYVACHCFFFTEKLDLTRNLRPGGIFALNTPYVTIKDLDGKLPNRLKRNLAKKNAQFYVINATDLARNIGLGPRINMIMQASFYQLADVMPPDEAIALLKDRVEKVYGKKGPEVVQMNLDAIDTVNTNLIKLDIPESWAELPDDMEMRKIWGAGQANEFHDPMPGQKDVFYGGDVDRGVGTGPDFIRSIMEPVLALEGDSLPVSAFEAGGVTPNGTTRFERRGGAPAIPVWKTDLCTQCNYCAIACPHAVIRPFLMDKPATKLAPDGYKSAKAQGAELGGYNYSIQISPYDCTGCEVCVQICPDDALYMAPFTEVGEYYLPHWEYSFALPNVDDKVDKFTVKGSQFQQPLLEFSCACSGCGETPYAKLVTQLYGHNMIIANASGCSSVWGGTSTTAPYTVHNETGRGPAWGRSLFEDNAEYGYGMLKATKQRRKAMKRRLEDILETEEPSAELRGQFKALLAKWEDITGNANIIVDKILPLLEAEKNASDSLMDIYDQRSMLVPSSIWLLGGDGWAYDIGFGGLDHVLGKGENVNILVMDTEIYSNTGGQSSKSTMQGAVTKFDSTGKETAKKDLGQMAMSYGNVYVGSVAIGADMNHTVKVFQEAATYDGPSIIMAYSPCIDWGFDLKYQMDIQKTAVDTGYWNLYRYDPRKADPMQLDSKKIRSSLDKYMGKENRYKRLHREHKDRAERLQDSLSEFIQIRHKNLVRQSLDDLELLDFLKKSVGEQTSEKMTVLYGSETGNAADMASNFAFELKRRNMRASVLSLDDCSVDELQDEGIIVMFIATCGQGEMPGNMKNFYKDICDTELPADYFKGLRIAVFGMGDTHYVHFNSAAKMVAERMEALGAEMLMDMALADDQDEDKYETAWESWGPDLYNKLQLPEPEKVLLPPTWELHIGGAKEDTLPRYIFPGTKLCDVVENRVITPKDYYRDTRHYGVDITDKGLSYELGDALAVYPRNDGARIHKFMEFMGVEPDTVYNINDDRLEDDKKRLPAVMTAMQVYGDLLDITGKPKRKFYEMMELTAMDDGERAEIAHLLSGEGASDMRMLVKETVDHFDLLQKFPSVRPELHYLLDYVPRVKPRLYSIASSPNLSPDRIEMCIVRDDWETPAGVEKSGVCSTYLTGTSTDGLDQGQLVCTVNAGVIPTPDHSLPMIVSALGTGLAPVRAILLDREWELDNGGKVGKTAMYYGCRTRKDEYYYDDEGLWKRFWDKGILTHEGLAFSRDQEHKIYIQDKVKQDAEMIYKWLYEEDGYFYACGSSAVNDLKGYIAENFGDMSQEDALKYLDKLCETGKYNVESW